MIVLEHQGTLIDINLDPTLDEQLKTVLDFINDLTRISDEYDYQEQAILENLKQIYKKRDLELLAKGKKK